MQLKNGMIALYNNVRPIEVQILQTQREIFFYGHNNSVPPEINNLLPCFFHWFGISLCNYARLAGYIVAKEQGHLSNADLQPEPKSEKIKKACNNYVNSLPEIQEVLKWRNKVSAHFALTDPRPEDNIATLEASIIYPIGFENKRFRTGTMIFTINDSDSEIPSWSLTETFEILINRFWPDVTVTIPAEKTSP